ncbi:SRPBCC family protein [Caldivirga maquilingensis]|uniref:Carbon monoxide dehydrogenase subunit G n=1 Tax=Caldivirga maquilingensis (strain ATCC 700844 / DSM 13496 / JCM 10307 / IC-167) TaxID=397948 RepID=A8MAZ0_CALMQ|nr:carbon monoxide dehydrogenase subunit G [Caldivirga maquilingensis]ABW02619.1 carbon monoxide dehydrogenase subunit G [Caldivirga maquilingensis IC-167]
MANLHYSGSFNLTKPPREVTGALSNLSLVIKCIPNVTSYELISESKAKVRFRVDLGDEVPVAELRRVTSDTVIEVTEASESSIRLRVNGRAAGSSIEVTLSIIVEPNNGGSRVNWSADAGLGRLLQMMGRFINIDSMVERIANDTINGIVKCLS